LPFFHLECKDIENCQDEQYKVAIIQLCKNAEMVQQKCRKTCGLCYNPSSPWLIIYS